jgi:hypothetical protein
MRSASLFAEEPMNHILLWNTVTLLMLVVIAILNALAMRSLTKMLANQIEAFIQMRNVFGNLLKAISSQVSSAPVFICPRCGRSSYNPQDIVNRYCGVCGFADDGPPVLKPNA